MIFQSRFRMWVCFIGLIMAGVGGYATYSKWNEFTDLINITITVGKAIIPWLLIALIGAVLVVWSFGWAASKKTKEKWKKMAKARKNLLKHHDSHQAH